MNNNKIMKQCQICKSSKLTEAGEGWFRCEKCGNLNKELFDNEKSYER